jgi:hypothetical protein
LWAPTGKNITEAIVPRGTIAHDTCRRSFKIGL